MRLPVGVVSLGIILIARVCLADYSVSDKGLWPSSWPKELEVLRKSSRTLIGPRVEYRNYAIPFTDREHFEKLWPHLLSVKTKDAPVILVKAPNFFLGKEAKAGVIVHSPPAGQENAQVPAGVKVQERSMYTTYIELVVDGDVIDLNRINLSTVVVDERFKETTK